MLKLDPESTISKVLSTLFILTPYGKRHAKRALRVRILYNLSLIVCVLFCIGLTLEEKLREGKFIWDLPFDLPGKKN